MPLTSDAGLEAGDAAVLTQQILAEVRKRPGLDVVSQEEVGHVLSLEQQKQLLGCNTDKCRVDFGNVLGVDRMVQSNLSKLGESWLLHIKLLDVQKVTTISQVDRRQRGGSKDDLLDAIPAMVAQLLSKDVIPNVQTSVASTVVAPVAQKNLSPNGVDTPLDRKKIPADLKVATDGAGRYVAWTNKGERTLFAGDGKTFYLQRVRGYSQSGDTSFDFGFWEPRVRDPWMGSFGFKDGALHLYCGEKPQPWKALADKDAKALLDKAVFNGPRWQRMPVVLARDDNGTHYLVDTLRDGNDKDYRMFIGPRGKMVAAQISDAMPEGNELLILVPTGRLKVDFEKNTAEWGEGQVKTPLKFLAPDMNHVMIYSDLSPYKGEALGTACDGKL